MLSRAVKSRINASLPLVRAVRIHVEEHGIGHKASGIEEPKAHTLWPQ